MAVIDSFKAAVLAVVRGFGLCKVNSTEGERWKLTSIADKKDFVEIKLEKLEALLRAPMGGAEAAEVLAKLMEKMGEPDARDWGDQYLEHGPALKTGTPAAQAAVLQKLFRVAAPDEMQQCAIGKLEEVLLPELAQALKKKIGSLRSQLHKGSPRSDTKRPSATTTDRSRAASRSQPVGKSSRRSGSSAASSPSANGRAASPRRSSSACFSTSSRRVPTASGSRSSATSASRTSTCW